MHYMRLVVAKFSLEQSYSTVRTKANMLSIRTLYENTWALTRVCSHQINSHVPEKKTLANACEKAKSLLMDL